MPRQDGSDRPDDVLTLLFSCCHPQLPHEQQIALALHRVLGLTSKEVASAFLVSEAEMDGRICAARRVVESTGTTLESGSADEYAQRLDAVATMVYLLFNEAYFASHDEAPLREPLCGEAIRLARLLLRLFPTNPEIMGLTALLLLLHARTPARLDKKGGLVLLADQDRSRWNRERIDEGLALLDQAMQQYRPGPYQIQAAINAVHTRAPSLEQTDWGEIELLYLALEQLQPSPVVTLNRAVAVANLRGPAAALEITEGLAEPLSGYIHYYVARGTWLKELGRTAEARAAFENALALARTPAQAASVRGSLDRLGQGRACQGRTH